jgi:hypothetical protein
VSQPKPQNYANHSRFDPLFHFVLAPFLLFNWIATLVFLVRHPGPFHAWMMLVALALFLMLGVSRSYALKVQDRVIRLEERLRLNTLLQEPLRARIGELSESQLIGLRFASDAEIPALVARTLGEKLTQKQIKQAIQNWRADHFRV